MPVCLAYSKQHQVQPKTTTTVKIDIYANDDQPYSITPVR